MAMTTFSRSDEAGLRTLVGSPREFNFGQAAVSQRVNGLVTKRVLPLTVKGLDAERAMNCLEGLSVHLINGRGKGIKFVDIQYLRVEFDDGTKENLDMTNDAIKGGVETLREIYVTAATESKIPVYWPKFADTEYGDLNGPRSLACPTDRTREMSQWPANKIITSLNIRGEEDTKKAEHIEEFTNAMVGSLQVQINQIPPNSEERKKALIALQNSFSCVDRTAITAAATDIEFSVLERALKEETGKDSFFERISRDRNSEMTPAERTHLEDINLLKAKSTEEIVSESLAYGRPPTQDSFERILLRAMEDAVGVDDGPPLDRIVDRFCSHRLVAGIPNLHDDDLLVFKEDLKHHLFAHFHG